MTDQEGITEEEKEREKPWYEKHTKWINETIKQRDCLIFSRETDEVCICKKTKEQHEIKEGNKKWKRDVNTSTEPTKYYGTAIIRKDNEEGVEIGDEEGDVEAQEDSEHFIEFIRLDEETPVEDVRHLLFEVWNLPRPKWIFCLLGTKMEKSDLRVALRNAFEKLSVTTDVWCLTDGLGGSLSENVQEAKTVAHEYQTCRITSLGCNSWGELCDLDELKETEKKRIVEYTPSDWYTMGATTSHFLRVDSGTEEPYLCYLSTVSFYVKLVASLASPQDASSAIPVVALLHGGDELILLEYVKNLIKESIPVVVIKNNEEGVAKLVCQAYENSKGHTKSSSRDNSEGQVTVIDQFVKNKIKALAEEYDEEKSEESVQTILQCLQRRDLITVVDGEDEDEDVLFHGIISAIVKTKTSAELNALVDEYLPTPVYNRKTKEKAEQFQEQQQKKNFFALYESQEIVNEIFLEALLREKTECVEFIIETGAVDIIEDLDLEGFYLKTRGDLQKNVAKAFKDAEDDLLVKSVVGTFLEDIKTNREKDPIYKRLTWFLKRCEDKEKKSLLGDGMKNRIRKIVKNAQTEVDLSNEVAKFLRICMEKGADIQLLCQTVNRPLTREETHTIFSPEERIGSAKSMTTQGEKDDDITPELIKAFVTKITQRFFPHTCIQEERDIETEENESHDETFQRKQRFRYLFLWAVLTNRKETARTLWKRGEDLIVSALVAGTLMDSLAELTFNSRKKQLREKSALFYKQQAMGTIEACYTNDKDKTVLLLNKITKENAWNVDLLALAFEEKNSCVFRCDGLSYFTHRRWMGDLPKDTPLWKIIICTVLPVFIWLLISVPDTAKRGSSMEVNKDNTGVDATEDVQKNENTNEEDKEESKDMEHRSRSENRNPMEMEHRSQRENRLCEKLRKFYSAPVVKFVLSLVFYLMFIGLYAHFLLVVLKFEFTWNWELSLLVWMIAFTCEELIQVLQFAYERKQDSNRKKARRKHHDQNDLKRFLHAFRKYAGIYFQDKWNILDAFCILGFCIAYPLRWFQVTYSYGRLFLSINFMCFFWRLLQACTPSRSLGPTLYMIFKMVGDLVPFLVILFAAILSYAIATEALMFPNSDLSFAFFLEIPRKAFWQIFGEFSFEDIDGSNCGTGPCPTQIGRTWVPYFMAAYVIMTNVLLINIIIARFNHIFEEVRQNTNEVWAWQKCRLMMEYDSKPPLPLPFTIFWRIGVFVHWSIKKCKSMRRNKVSEKGGTGKQGSPEPSEEGGTGKQGSPEPSEEGGTGKQGSPGPSEEGGTGKQGSPEPSEVSVLEELDGDLYPHTGNEEYTNIPPVVTAGEVASRAVTHLDFDELEQGVTTQEHNPDVDEAESNGKEETTSLQSTVIEEQATEKTAEEGEHNPDVDEAESNGKEEITSLQSTIIEEPATETDEEQGDLQNPEGVDNNEETITNDDEETTSLQSTVIEDPATETDDEQGGLQNREGVDNNEETITNDDEDPQQPYSANSNGTAEKESANEEVEDDEISDGKESDYYDDSSSSSQTIWSDESSYEYEEEMDYEHTLDIFERQNAEYYLQTEKDKLNYQFVQMTLP